MTTFTLNNGATYTLQDNGYCFSITDGKKTRCSAATFKLAHDLFVKAENERQNANNLFTNIDPIGTIVEATEEDIITEETKEIQDMYCRHPEGTDLQKPAEIGEHGCVDCRGCNVQNCVHRNCMRRNPTDIGGLAECPRLKVSREQKLDDAAEDPKVTIEEFVGMVEDKPKAKKERKPRRSKDIAFEATIQLADDKIADVTLTAKQVDFIKHLSDTCFWEDGLDSVIWVDCLCDDIGGQFAGKPMTVGAMISTLCEKDLGHRASERKEGRKCTSFTFTELGKRVAAELGLN